VDRRTALNTAIAAPVGLVGGAVAGEFIGEGINVASVIFGGTPSNSNLLYSLTGSLGYAIFGAVIGVLSFPIAYATVARTRNVFVVVPAALVATVVGCWIGMALLAWLDSTFHIPMWGEPWAWFTLALMIVFPVATMFWACAWAAARERRKNVR